MSLKSSQCYLKFDQMGKKRRVKVLDALIWPTVVAFQVISNEVHITESRKHWALFKQADS